MGRDSSLKKKALMGLFWSYAERFAAQAVGFIVSIILARLIAPSEYGMIAIVAVFTSIANVFVTDGLASALVQKKDADELDFSTIIWFGLMLSLFLVVILWVAAIPISGFYKMPGLVMVIRVMSFNIPVASFNSVQRAYLSKRLQFKNFFVATFIGTVVSAVVGIYMALEGAGVWALVAQNMLNTVIDTIALFVLIRRKPLLQFSKDRLKPLFSYGWRILCVSLMTTLYINLRSLIIGKKFSSEDLAYSNKGQQFPSLISTNINASITNVIFPILSNAQDDIEKVLSLMRRAIKTGTFLMAPVLLGLAAVAEPLIKVLITEKWLPCVPYMQIMCVVFLLQPIQTASIQAMKALGKGQLYMRLEIVKKIFGIAVLAISVIWFSSVEAIIWSALVAEVMSTVLNFPANKKLLDYGYVDQVVDVGKPLISASLMWLILYYVNTILVEIANETGVLILEIGIGGLVYIFASVLIKDESFYYILKSVKGIRVKDHR